MEITLEQVRAKAAEIVQGNEEFVYTKDGAPGSFITCRYVKEGEPSCLVGKVLAGLGVPLSVLEDMDKADSPSIEGDGLHVLAEVGDVTVGHGVPQYLATLQRVQDSIFAPNSWAAALMSAEETASRYTEVAS
jgi:hypothetical protein